MKNVVVRNIKRADPNAIATFEKHGVSTTHEALGRYNLYCIERAAADSPQRWRIEMVGRGLADPAGPVVELDRRELSLDVGRP